MAIRALAEAAAMKASLEELLTASLALEAARKAAPLRNPPEFRSGELRVIPAPPPAGSEIPTVLSPSSTNMFLDCSMRWFYRKVLRLPEARGAALGLGTAVHVALVENFRQKIETREDLPPDGVRALFIHALIDELDHIALQPDESPDDLKVCGETMIRMFMDRIAPAIEPAAVEEPVSGEIGGVPVHGYIDILDVHGRVIDIKTAARKPSGITPPHQLQLTTYAMLHPEASGAAQIVTLTKTRTVGCYTDSVDIGPRDRKLAESLYSVARDRMHAGVYWPNRASHLCSRKYCGYAKRCEAEFGGEVRA